MLLNSRSTDKEYLDNCSIETKDLYRNLVELDIINKRLGGYNASRKGLTALLNATKAIHTVLDIGFGGGDSIKELSKFSNKNNAKLFFYGIDLKNDCLSMQKVIWLN